MAVEDLNYNKSIIKQEVITSNLRSIFFFLYNSLGILGVMDLVLVTLLIADNAIACGPRKVIF